MPGNISNKRATDLVDLLPAATAEAEWLHRLREAPPAPILRLMFNYDAYKGPNDALSGEY